MIKKLSISIKAIEEDGEFGSFFGTFSGHDVSKLVDASAQEDMECMAFIDLPYDTYFNQLQCRTIKNELRCLNMFEGINRDLLQSIGEAADFAIENDTFIKFEVENHKKDFTLKTFLGFG